MTPEPLSQLAVHGGSRLRVDPFPQRGHVGHEERAAIDALFDRAIATGVAPGYNGEEENAYCEEFAAYMGGGYVDAVSSGTAGIYVALHALDLEPFSEVIVASVTDPGGLMPVPLLNLIPVIADTAPNSYNTGPAQVEALVSPLTSAILVSHIAGEPADVAGIAEIARRRGIPLIEDCSQSHGATLHGKLVGTYGEIGVFSTMSGKHHCSGGQGGVVYARDEALYQAIRRASDRGKPFFLPPGATNAIASLNLNLNDLAAAIGRVQLRKLPETVRRRRAIVAGIAEGISGVRTVAIPEPLPGAEPSYWFLRMRFNAEEATCDKETYCRALSAEGLAIAPHYRAALPHTMDWFVHRRVFGSSGYPWSSPDYAGDPERQFPCPNANATMDTHFNLHFHESWTPGDVADAAAILRKVDRAYSAQARA
ncbi:MAG: DegT/DnrJ/EryC1/StrS family aminotransferase [Anaerolineae bacterium]|nr:DegT/DnrJ/EryC1/StrS family aminotransferase [Anaerolineae bacterium]